MVDTDLLSSFNSLKINNFYKTINSLAKLYSNGLSRKAVLRIHLIFMRIRIWILDLQRKKMDPDPGYFHKIYRNFCKKAEFSKFVLFFLFICLLKLDKPFRNQEIFIISLFNRSDLGLESKHFFLQFLVDILPSWIQIRGSSFFCGSGSRKPKSSGSNGS